MKIKFNVKSNTIAAYCVIVFAVCLLLVAVVFKYNVILSYLNKIIGVLSPVIWGIAIAYILNPVMMFVDGKVERYLFKRKKRPKISRTIAVAASILLLIGVLSAIIGSIVPEVIETVKGLFMNMSSNLNNLQNYLNSKISNFASDNPKLNELFNTEFNSIQDFIITAMDRFKPKVDVLFARNGLLANLTDSAWSIFNGFKNFILGIIVSVYLLYSKETLIAQMKKIVYAAFSEKKRRRILSVSSKINHKFGRFISGKMVDSLIIGIICFIGMLFMNMKNYAVIISVIVGITNLIPFFGPVIGGVISGFLILLTTPNKLLIFLVFVLLLQQFDGNILGPKILGDSLGLSPFWVIFAIFVGGGLFGFAGMILVVPLFSVLYGIISDIVSEQLKRKRLPLETKCYIFEGDGLSAEPPDKKSTVDKSHESLKDKAEKAADNSSKS